MARSSAVRSKTSSGKHEETEIPSAVARRVETLRAYYDALGIKDAETFLSETVNSDGIRTYESLWLLHRDAVFEAVISEGADDELDGVRLRDNLVRWASKSRNYDFIGAIAESRLQVTLWFADEIYGDLKATGDNCDRLRDLVARYIIPNIGVAASK